MFRLFRAIGILILTLTAVTIAVRFMAASYPSPTNPLLVTMFTNPDGKSCEYPCLFGIHPGVVQQQSDEERLKRFPWIKDVTLLRGSLSGWFDIAGQGATFFAASKVSVAIYLEIWDGFFPQPISFTQPNLEDIVTTFGVPDATTWNSGTLEFWYRNRNMLVFFASTNSRPKILIDRTLRVEGIIIFASDAVAPKEFQGD